MRQKDISLVRKRPGRIPAIWLPRVRPLATDWRLCVTKLIITPIVVPTARTTAETVKPYFLRMFLTLTLCEVPSSSSSLSLWRATFRSITFSLIAWSSFSSSAIPRSSWIDFCSSSISVSFCVINLSCSGPSEVLNCFRSDRFNLFFFYTFLHHTRDVLLPWQNIFTCHRPLLL